MPDSTSVITTGPARCPAPPQPKQRRVLALKRRFPTSADLRAHAQKRLLGAAYEYCDGGAGGFDTGIRARLLLNARDRGQRRRAARWIAAAGCVVCCSRPTSAAPVGRRNDEQTGLIYPGAETNLLKGVPRR